MNTVSTLENSAVNPSPAGMSRREALRRAAIFLGAALAPSVLSGALQAATEAAPANAKARFLTLRQYELVEAMAERIVPRTDTPGATDVGVPQFIDLMYGKFLSPAEKAVFAKGLEDFTAACVAAHQVGFVRLSPLQQDDMLMKGAVAAMKLEKTFFHQIKELTVVGYFTSEIVGREVLHYDPVPGRFDGCVPISEVGNRLWTK